MFELRGVTVVRGTHRALDEVDLVVGPGERVALLGPSGAGKSTLLALLSGATDPDTGAVLLFGEDLARLAHRRRRELTARVGALTQDLDLVEHVRVLHNVAAGRLGRIGLGPALLRLLTARADDEVREVLARVDLPWALHARTQHLSGGERQRVAVARLLLQRAEAVLADEPASSLDPTTARDVLELLRGSATTGTTVVSLHQPSAARHTFTRVVGLRRGRVALDLPPGRLTDDLLDDLYARA
ncbi:ATP-binding cassette domain-containing protein [Geodermatophilus sp. YIM 151500]|uniref:phosphonate ABC transporter ATP-binding protein n=1 Tax=Geodermatophilus sp. YIM 151500 TaxID=2984531 RepID=UPI0021E369F8|nr:ATP-binding cassette domain-containing protein [Geodermatophilus sp. YIM 151500]MCV2490822.1 ATP-binding cassette domain-containing protein [Geodermatophilus sp. YIM 151500]